MTNENVTITAEQVEELLSMYHLAEKRIEKNPRSNRIDEYRAEAIAIDKMLDIMGIEH